MKPAARMQAVVDFVTTNPGSPAIAVIAHVKGTLASATAARDAMVTRGDDRREKRVFKQAASAVERAIKTRLVRQDGTLKLHPWDAKRKAYAEALATAAFAAPDEESKALMLDLAAAAWRRAGDENAARILERLLTTGPSA